MELFPEVRAVVAKLLAIDAGEITPEAHLHFDLGADSLALENLALTLSEKYDIEIKGEDLVELENVGALVSLVESRVAVK